MNDSLGALLAIAVIWLVVKLAFGGAYGGSANARPTRGLTTARARPVPQELVDTVQAMFPQVPEASIRYDLSRTGNVEATCDRILREGALPPPPSGLFQTPPGGARSDAPGGQRAASGSIEPAARPTAGVSAAANEKAQDLISRFNLQSRLSASERPGQAAVSSSASSSTGSWSESRQEREQALRSRKEAVILEARR
ncbi:hypothetical protein K437DRAFT_225436 [Tilletiaria anomala UBC 951]|uniref:Coupling of ubiquitin conjugation to ER degradation protein 1 n=1 Tax=Tilletiaria anomala (strain ATCC 24038 / CBS 436.72 / UBC 951) TaxID=1037660 RepID=A0A066VPT7_TILAU|nr:uncharacterized protein K437DRAFT_225436 [Tilletiaria anomala UBC 951]KDN43757.1 hypothetical protein K437DRAFT_225436 [Tilletiaria anomala UBC 951]